MEPFAGRAFPAPVAPFMSNVPAALPIPATEVDRTGRAKDCCDTADRLPAVYPNRVLMAARCEITVSRPSLVMRVDLTTPRRSVVMHPHKAPDLIGGAPHAVYPSFSDSGDFWLPRPGTYYFVNGGPSAYEVVVLDMPDCCIAAVYLGVGGALAVTRSLTLGYLHRVFANSPYPVGTDDFTIEWDCTLGASILNLPAIAAGNLGRIIVAVIDVVDVSGNGLSVTPAGADTIAGVGGATVLVAPGAGLKLQSDGVGNWVVLP